MPEFTVTTTCRSDAPTSNNFHTHDCGEIIYVKSGSIIFHCGDASFNAAAGDLFIIGKLEKHSTETLVSPYMRYCITVSYEHQSDNPELEMLAGILTYSVSGRCCIIHTGEAAPLIEKLLTDIIDNHSSDCPMNDEYLSSLVQQLLIALYRAAPGLFRNGAEHKSKQFYDVQKYLDTSFTSPLSISELAKKYFISEDYLSHCFKDITGYSPKQYISKKRLVYAKKLLTSTSLSISEVSAKCGFGDTNNFSRSFKKQFGVSPAESRKIQRRSP